MQMLCTTPNATEKQDDEHRNKRTQELTLPFFVGATLLPGDGKLSQTQKQRLLDAKEALDARYPDRPLDAETPLDATFGELAKLQAEGKIRHVGLCNFGVNDLKAALASGLSVVSDQMSYGLLWCAPPAHPMPVAHARGS